MAMEQARNAQNLQHENTRAHTVIALAPHLDQVVAAVRRLHEAGFGSDEISLLAKDGVALRDTVREVGARNGTEIALPDDVADAVEPKGRDEMAGFAIGGAVGFLVGLSAVAIPGFGPFLLAAGPVAIALNALTVSAAGMGLGALLGAILDENVTEEHKKLYHDRLEEGWWMILVKADGDRAMAAREAIEVAGVTNVETL